LQENTLPNLFIIAGCNGAGKTTASYTVLPELLDVKEFVNADEIAKGLSPFQPEKASIEAGKIMLKRLQDLINQQVDFAFETTLSSKIFTQYIDKAKAKGYSVRLVFYWLDSVELAIERVKIRVLEGGHSIPTEVIIRRYYAGLKNFLSIYRSKVDYWMLFDNSKAEPEIIAEGQSEIFTTFNKLKWEIIDQIAAK
jgi:predicted ABC-type ATPase